MLRFDGRVAVITGAGNGLGKAYAIELAKRGCAVVVNDLGGSIKGEAAAEDAPRPADLVVSQIVAAGGKAVPNYDSVEHGAKIIDTAINSFGRVDIVINNAGILRDKTFKRMEEKDWDLVMTVHLKGVYAVSKAAWAVMNEQGYGRIVNVASPAGLYGNVGQANYSTAKMGMMGFTQTLAKEGSRKNIKVNCIAPVAGTRMLETVFPPDMVKLLKPEYIVSLVGFLCHEECEETGAVFECSGGVYQKVQLVRATGWTADLSKGDPSIEDVRDHIDTISEMDNAELTDTNEVGSRDGIRNIMEHAESIQAKL